MWAYDHGQTDRHTDRQTHRRGWPQYILHHLRLTQNVISPQNRRIQTDTNRKYCSENVFHTFPYKHIQLIVSQYCSPSVTINNRLQHCIFSLNCKSHKTSSLPWCVIFTLITVFEISTGSQCSQYQQFHCVATRTVLIYFTTKGHSKFEPFVL